MRGRLKCIAFLSAFAALGAAGGGVASGAQLASAPHTVGKLTYRGTTNLTALADAGKTSANPTQTKQGTPRNHKPGLQLGATRTGNPNPPSEPLVTQSDPPLGFVGLTAADSGLLNGIDLEPPDQGLCAHGNTVMEVVNLALDVYTESGIRQVAPVSLNAFFGLAPFLSRNGKNTTSGPFLADPRCYYDAQTQRWFVTALEIDTDPYTGNFANNSRELIAVSQTSDPTGSYGLFELPSSDDGSSGQPSLPNCPCFGDQPRIGADSNGFYISDDVFSIQNSSVNGDGGFLYAISKQQLVSAAASGGQGTPNYAGIWIGAVVIGGYPANAVQPAETPQTGAYPSDREYFLSTPDFNGFATSGGAGASSVVLWTLLNTSTLNSSSPSLTLTDQIVPSEPFTPPVNAVQRPGANPLGQAFGDPVEPLNVDDDRMQQVQYAGGRLYSSLETGVGPSSSARTGVAWFDVRTSGTDGTVEHQGYLATGNGASLMYPAIGVNPSGRGVMTFSVSGPKVAPSGAYVPFNKGPTGNSITVHAPGNLPEDGFTCYPQTSVPPGPPCRWGDYSAATYDGAGHIVTGDEMITNLQRDQYANWDTFIATVPVP